MRLFYVLVLLFLFNYSHGIKAQENTCGFLIPGGTKSWNVLQPNRITNAFGDEFLFQELININYVLAGDTLIDNVFSQKLHIVTNYNGLSDSTLIGFYSCDGDHVLYNAIPIPANQLLYQNFLGYDYYDLQVLNFGAGVGDTILRGLNDIGGDLFILVDAVDTVTYLDNVPRRRLSVRDVQYQGGNWVTEYPLPTYLVEGIGAIRTGLNLHGPRFSLGFDDNTLLCYHENGELVYQSEDYPNLDCDDEIRATTDTTYVPLLEDGVEKRWNLLRFSFSEDTFTRTLYHYQDTLIDGYTFEKFYLTDSSFYDSQSFYGSGVYQGAFREEGRRVYFQQSANPYQPADRPLIDFGTGLYDTIFRFTDAENFFYYGIIRGQMDRVFMDGRPRTRSQICLYSIDQNDPAATAEAVSCGGYLIEGMLTLQSSYRPNNLLTYLIDNGNSYQTHCYWEDDFQVFKFSNFFTDDISCVYNSLVSSTQDFRSSVVSYATAFPNPTGQLLTVRVAGGHRLVQAELMHTAAGRRFPLSTTIRLGNQYQLDLGDHPAGHYFLLLQYADGSVERLGVVKR